MEQKLLQAPRRSLCGSGNWTEDVPVTPGVYAVWHTKSGALVYVGETSCLHKRMADIGRWRNHTCRRKLGAQLGFGGQDERALSSALARDYTLSFLAVDFGRTELEEYLYIRWRETLINSPPRRIFLTNQYAWVTPAAAS